MLTTDLEQTRVEEDAVVDSIPPEVAVIAQDGDDRKRAEALLAGQNRILEMVARGHPLRETLEDLCRLVESIDDRCGCIVFLAGAQGTRIKTGIGPSMPPTFPDAVVILITGPGDTPTSVKAMKAGAIEFLTKPFTSEAVLDAIRDAHDRSREIQAVRDCYSSLTERQRQVMERIVVGFLNKQVGDALGISEITVKAHRRQVMQKMKASSFAHLVTMAARLGMGPSPRA